MTKKEEYEALEIAKKCIQEAFIDKFGFAPAKKDIIPLEVSFIRWCEMYIVEDMDFRVKKIGWVYTKIGTIERADQYDAENY